MHLPGRPAAHLLQHVCRVQCCGQRHLKCASSVCPPACLPTCPPLQAFYIPLTELPHWAQTHPEDSPQQVLALTACIAESSGLKRKDKAALLAHIEGNLRAMSGGGSMGA